MSQVRTPPGQGNHPSTTGSTPTFAVYDRKAFHRRSSRYPSITPTWSSRQEISAAHCAAATRRNKSRRSGLHPHDFLQQSLAGLKGLLERRGHGFCVEPGRARKANRHENAFRSPRCEFSPATENARGQTALMRRRSENDHRKRHTQERRAFETVPRKLWRLGAA